ncbi:MAG: MFS transporter [Acidimicrobiia bacterium]
MTLRSTKWVFWVLTAALWLPVGFLLPVLVLTMIERGLSLQEVGLGFATYGLTTVVFELPTGGFADSLGRRPILMVAAALQAVMAVIWFAADDVWVIVVAAFIGGVSRALSSGPLEAWYVDTTHSIEQDAAIRPGLAGAEVAGGLTIAFGSLAVTAMTFIPAIASSDGAISADRLPLLVAAAASLVNIVAVALLMKEDAPHGRSVRSALGAIPRVMRRSVQIARRPGAVRLLLMATFLFGIGIVSVEFFYQPLFRGMVDDAASATRLFGVLGFGLALGSAAGSAAAGVVPEGDGFRPGRMGAAALVAVAVGIVGLALSGSILVGSVFFICIYTVAGFAHPFSQQILHDNVESSERATMVSAQSLSVQAGALVTTIGLAQLAAYTDITSALLLGAVAVCGASALFLAIDRMHVSTPEIEATSDVPHRDPSLVDEPLN